MRREKSSRRSMRQLTESPRSGHSDHGQYHGQHHVRRRTGDGGGGLGLGLMASGRLNDNGVIADALRHPHNGPGKPAPLPESTASDVEHSPLDGSAAGSSRWSDAEEELEENIVTLPRSTHSWLFTQDVASLPFWFAVAIVLCSYTCLVLAMYNVFEETAEPGNFFFNIPAQVSPPVRCAQYLALIIALIMEEELPTGLYLLRMISKESLHKKFPKIQFARFFASAIVRLVMGYLFLLNTFLVVAYATEVLDIFYDVLALQFLQQLDDISFNLARIDVFGKDMKQSTMTKHFRTEFTKQPSTLRTQLNYFLKGLYLLNLFGLLAGMVAITVNQNSGQYHPEEITVTFGEHIWNEAIVKTAAGEEVRPLLFAYFNGVYRRDAELKHDRNPVYVEQNKFDGSPYSKRIPAKIQYCKSIKAWVFFHDNITKSKHEEPDCPWLLRSPEISHYNLLDVTGDWSIWVGSVQETESFSTIENECHQKVDCNYNGECRDGKCECDLAEDGKKDNSYFGTRCEHPPACTLITGGVGGTWEATEHSIYQRPVYRYKQGAPTWRYQEKDLNPLKDAVFLVYTGSRWLGTVYKDVNVLFLSEDQWEAYEKEYHAFWENIYSNRTLFTSEPTTQSSIIGLDFFMLGEQGPEYGPFGQLFPLSDPEGSGFMRCVENDPPPPEPPYDVNYVGVTANSNSNSVGVIIEYEIGRDRAYESDIFANDCTETATGFDIYTQRSQKTDLLDRLSLEYSFDKNSSIVNASGEAEICQVVRVIFPAVDSFPKMVVSEVKHKIIVG